MSNLSKEAMLLLDKTYNLKGDDNYLIKELDENIEKHVSDIESHQNTREELSNKKQDTEAELTVFTNQKDTFLNVFSSIDDDMFSALKSIGVDVNIASMVNEVSAKSPEFINELNSKIRDIQASINDSISEEKDLEDELESLKEDRLAKEKDRTELNNLFNQCLSSDENERDSIPTKYVKDILSKFDIFSKEDISKLAKIIMFPEDGLEEYDKNYLNRLNNGEININGEVEVTEEPTTVEETEEEVVEEKEEVLPVVEVEEETEVTEEETEPVIEIEEDTEPVTEPVVEDIHEEHPSMEDIYNKDNDDTTIINLTSLNNSDESEDKEIEVTVEEEPKEEQFKDLDIHIEDEDIEVNPLTQENPMDKFTDRLEKIGLRVEDFNKLSKDDKEKFVKLLDNVSDEEISVNYEILRSVDAADAAFKLNNEYSYLTDKELNSKITLLRTKDITEHMIKKMLLSDNNGLDTSYEELKNRLDSISELDGEVNENNINKISIDLGKYKSNLDVLNKNGFDIEDTEKRNYSNLLYNSKDMAEDMEILKDYMISIIKKNDRYALNIFYKRPQELVTDIDKIIEINQEKLLTTNPEVLGYSSYELLKRIKYVENNNEVVLEDDNKYADYIVDPIAFYKKFGNITLPEVPNVNNSLLDNKLVSILDEYYNSKYTNIELEDESVFEKLRNTFEDKLKVEEVGKYTYKLNDIYISRNKFERNLKVLINSGNTDNEVLVTAALYNSYLEEDEFKEAMELISGGI